MIACRPIRADEAENYLHLLCEVFDLDQSRAGQVFYSEPFYDLTRKWALFEHGVMTSILSMTPLEFGWGRAIGIAGVATRTSARGRGLGQRLLESALGASEEQAALLFAYRPTLYARVGFEVIDEVISGELTIVPDPDEVEPIDTAEVKRLYSLWSEGHPDRLRRDAQRWEAWQWVYRPCEAFAGGYLCAEPMLCREVICTKASAAWPVMTGSRWSGLKSFTQLLQVPLSKTRHELLLMGRNMKSVPQMFMTDQF